MKTKIKRKAKQLASTLLIALVICSILSISIVGYLSMTEQQNFLSARSQAWNLAIAIVEAGLEEALEQLNTNTTQLSSDGWTPNAVVPGLYSRTRYLPDGNRYTVTINTSVFPSEIISKAFVTPPSLVKNGSSTFLAAEGVTLQPSSIARAVRVRASKGSLFSKAMVAKLTIDMNGQNILTDSFDSSNPSYSTSGHYDVTKARDMGDVASNATIINSVNVGNANIYGHVSTGPGGTVALGSHGAIGSHAWQALGNEGQMQGWVTADSNFTFPDNLLPYTSGLNPAAGDVVTTTFPISTNSASSTNFPSPFPWGGVTTNPGPYVTTVARPNPVPPFMTINTVPSTTTSYPAAGTYAGIVQTNYHGNGNSSSIDNYTWNMITGYTYPSYINYAYSLYTTNTLYTTNHYDHVLIGGDYSLDTALSGTTYVVGSARLVLPNGLTMSDHDTITVGPNGNLAMYVGGTSCTIGGDGIINKNGYASNLQIFCTPSVTSIDFNGNGEFIGVLNAPNANTRMNGGGYSDNDFIGALVVNTVVMNGHFGFHYDEVLGRVRNNGRLLITSWDEIRPQ